VRTIVTSPAPATTVAEEETAPVQFTVLPNFTLLPATTTEAADTATPAVTAGTTQQATTTTPATTTTVKTDTIKDRRNNFFRKKAPRRFNFRRRPALRKLVPAVEEEDSINEVEPAVRRPAVRPPPLRIVTTERSRASPQQQRDPVEFLKSLSRRPAPTTVPPPVVTQPAETTVQPRPALATPKPVRPSPVRPAPIRPALVKPEPVRPIPLQPAPIQPVALPRPAPPPKPELRQVFTGSDIRKINNLNSFNSLNSVVQPAFLQQSGPLRPSPPETARTAAQLRPSLPTVQRVAQPVPRLQPHPPPALQPRPAPPAPQSRPVPARQPVPRPAPTPIQRTSPPILSAAARPVQQLPASQAAATRGPAGPAPTRAFPAFTLPDFFNVPFEAFRSSGAAPVSGQSQPGLFSSAGQPGGARQGQHRTLNILTGSYSIGW